MKLFKRPPTRLLSRTITASVCCLLAGPMLGFAVRMFVAGEKVAWAASLCALFLVAHAIEMSRASDVELEDREIEKAKLDRELEAARAAAREEREP